MIACSVLPVESYQEIERQRVEKIGGERERERVNLRVPPSLSPIQIVEEGVKCGGCKSRARLIVNSRLQKRLISETDPPTK